MVDYLIVGAGLFGSIFAYEAKKRGYSCLVVEKRNHIGGNVYNEIKEGIPLHSYGAHIFHTSDEQVWSFINKFISFNNFINSPIANYQGKLYNLPFNMNTFNRIWPDLTTPAEVEERIAQQAAKIKGTPKNLEEQAISLVGQDIYEILIKEYTEKQWNRPCSELPAHIIKRLPVRLRFDNNYFTDKYQGIPTTSYNDLIEQLLDGVELRLNTNFIYHRAELEAMAKKIVYTGPIDEYFDYVLGHLQYRSLSFTTERKDMANYQGVAVMNFTGKEVDYTRIIEHKHFVGAECDYTYVTKEYPKDWAPGQEAYYPINDEANNKLYKEYAQLAAKKENIIFGGRLGKYAYYNMDQVIKAALDLAEKEFN